MSKQIKWTDELVLSRIRELHEQNINLSQKNITSLDRKLLYSAKRRFGNWGNAVTKAGVDYQTILASSEEDRLRGIRKSHKKNKREVVLNEIIEKEHYNEIVVRRRNGDSLHVLVDKDYVHNKRISLNKENRPYYLESMEYLYRVIVGAKKGDIIDHINRDVLDNRKCNLRFVTATQNSYNQKVDGVTYSNRKDVQKRWRVNIRDKGKTVTDRLFETKEEAKKYHTETVLKVRGRYAPIELQNK